MPGSRVSRIGLEVGLIGLGVLALLASSATCSKRRPEMGYDQILQEQAKLAAKLRAEQAKQRVPILRQRTKDAARLLGKARLYVGRDRSELVYYYACQIPQESTLSQAANRLLRREDRSQAALLLKTQRAVSAKVMEQGMLDKGYDFRVRDVEGKRPTLRIEYILAGRVMAHQMGNGLPWDVLARQCFARVVLTDGYDESYTYDLREPEFRALCEKSLNEPDAPMRAKCSEVSRGGDPEVFAAGAGGAAKRKK